MGDVESTKIAYLEGEIKNMRESICLIQGEQNATKIGFAEFRMDIKQLKDSFEKSEVAQLKRDEAFGKQIAEILSKLQVNSTQATKQAAARWNNLVKETIKAVLLLVIGAAATYWGFKK